MNKTSILLVLCILACIVVSGCSGTVDSGAERWRRVQQIWDIERRQFMDDSDNFWLLDRSSRMSRWHSRVGR